MSKQLYGSCLPSQRPAPSGLIDGGTYLPYVDNLLVLIRVFGRTARLNKFSNMVKRRPGSVRQDCAVEQVFEYGEATAGISSGDDLSCGERCGGCPAEYRQTIRVNYEL
jgi:hypothetical protein